MKLKGNSKTGLKMIAVISAVIFGLLFIVRLYQTFSLTDGATGFFTEHNFTVPVMYALLGIGVFEAIVLCYICKDIPMGGVKKKPSFLYIAAAFFFAVTLLYEGFINVRTVISYGGGFAGAKEALDGNIGVISTVFAILGGISVILSVFMYLKNGNNMAKLSIPMLFPVIWAFLKTLGFFSITVSYVKVSQLLLTIFYCAFLMVFLFENARVTTGIGRKDALWFFYATGIITAGLTLVSGVPAFLASIFTPDNTVVYCPFELYALSGGIYALSSMLIRAKESDDSEIIEVVTETE